MADPRETNTDAIGTLGIIKAMDERIRAIQHSWDRPWIHRNDPHNILTTRASKRIHIPIVVMSFDRSFQPRIRFRPERFEVFQCRRFPFR